MGTERLASQCRKGCIYAAKVGNVPICDYLGITGLVRPCPPGRTCSEWTDGKKKGGASMPRKATWDMERAKALLDEGRSLEDIAVQVGTTVAALKSWMQRNVYSGQKQERFRLQEPADDKCAEAAPPPPPPDEPPTTASEEPAAAVEAVTPPQPVSARRIEVSLNYGACRVTLAANSIEQARWVADRLVKMVELMDGGGDRHGPS